MGSQLITPLLSSPFPWVALCGLFFGAALSRATRGTRRARHPERAATRKWVLACLLLSVALACGLLAIFPPPHFEFQRSTIADTRWAWIAGAAAAVAFLALRFRRAAGIPVVVLVVALVAAVGLFFRGVRAYTGEREIATIRVISLGPSTMRLELSARGEPPVLLSMKGTQFATIVRVVIFRDLPVFLGARTWYRFIGLTSFDDNLRQQDTDFRFPNPPGISNALWKWVESHEKSLPFLKTAQTEMTLKRKAETTELTTYNVMIQNDGGVEVAPAQ